MDAKLIQELKKSKKIAMARGFNLPISTKSSVHVARYIKFLPLNKAKRILKEVIEKRRAIPYFRYNRDIPHRKELDGPVKSGRYPVKVAKYFLRLLNSVEKNAQFLGLNTEKMIIIHSAAYKGVKPPARMDYRGRIIRGKSTHIEIIAMEVDQYDPSKRYSRKAFKKLIKDILKEWYLKVSKK